MAKKRALLNVSVSNKRLHVWKFGVAVGVICAIYMLFVVLFADKFPMNAEFVEEIYGWLGYQASGIQAVLGVVYGFVDGLVGGAIVAWVYNKLL